MRLTIRLLVPVLALVLYGCASNQEAKFADVPGGPTPDNPVVKSAMGITGKVARYNRIGRFAILNFPLTQMPAVGQTLYVYREDLKVGEVKITGPQNDDNIIADLAKGEIQAGDEVRDR